MTYFPKVDVDRLQAARRLLEHAAANDVDFVDIAPAVLALIDKVIGGQAK